MMIFFKLTETIAWLREMLKMSGRTSVVSWSTQSLSTFSGMLSACRFVWVDSG